MIAIGLSLVGSFFSSGSLILMKFAHNRVVEKNKSAFKDPIWYLGFISLLVGTFFNIYALSYGNQTLLSSTSSFSIMFNTIFSVVFLREPLFRSDCLGILLICIGSTMFLLSAKNDDSLLTSDELYETYMRPTSIIYIVGSLLCLGVSLQLDKCIKAKILKFYQERNQ